MSKGLGVQPIRSDALQVLDPIATASEYGPDAVMGYISWTPRVRELGGIDLAEYNRSGE